MKEKFKWCMIMAICIPAVCIYFNTMYYIQSGLMLQTVDGVKVTGLYKKFGKITFAKLYRTFTVLFELACIIIITRSFIYSIIFILVLYALKCILFVILAIGLDRVVPKSIARLDLCSCASCIVTFFVFLSFTNYFYGLYAAQI